METQKTMTHPNDIAGNDPGIDSDSSNNEDKGRKKAKKGVKDDRGADKRYGNTDHYNPRQEREENVM